MGVYYYFHNKSKNDLQNIEILSGRFCCFITKFDIYDEKSQKEIFKKCISLNNWEKTDVILAVPDYYSHDVYKYENNKISIDNSEKDRFFSTQ